MKADLDQGKMSILTTLTVCLSRLAKFIEIF